MSEFQEYYVDRWVPDVELEAKLNSRPNCDLVHVFRNPASPGSVETTTLVWKIQELKSLDLDGDLWFGMGPLSQQETEEP